MTTRNTLLRPTGARTHGKRVENLSLSFEHLDERAVKQPFELKRTALSETAYLIEKIHSNVSHRVRRSSIERGRILQEISEVTKEVGELSGRQAEIEAYLDTIYERNR